MLETVRGPRQLMVGEGVAQNLPRVVAECGSRVLIVTDRVLLGQPRVAELVAAVQDTVDTVGVFADATPDVPLRDVDLAVSAAADVDADALLAIGGGTVIDLAKIVGVIRRHGGAPRDYYGESKVPGPTLPLVAVPTTSGTGSELTPVSVLTDPERELKVGVSSVHLVPDFAVVDPELTYTCPATVTAHSGIDAFCHAVESYTARPRAHGPRDVAEQVFLGRNPVTDHYALVAAERIARSLPRAVRDGGDADARVDMSYGSVLAGIAFSHAGNAAPHALQYPIGAATHTPHGLGVGLLLPYALTAARDAIGDRLATLAGVCGLDVADASEAEAGDAFLTWLVGLLAEIGIPASLAEIGVERADLPRFAEMAGVFPRSPRGYLDDWAAPEQGWLRKFYPADSDEPHLDATSAFEKAHAWVTRLRDRSFVGTESRLHTVVELLRQIVYGTETDPDVRLAELRHRRDELDAQIAAGERGEVSVLDDAGIRDLKNHDLGRIPAAVDTR